MRVTAHPAYPTLVVAGPRRRPGGAGIEQALTVIVKGTFAADDPAATPAPTQEPIRERDEVVEVAPDEQVMIVEHDLAITKPHADLVVVGPPQAPPGPGTLLAWTETLTGGGATRAKAFTPLSAAGLVTFGWEPRTSGPRQAHAAFAPLPSDPTALPAAFDNTFFNGAEYDGAAPPYAHLAPATTVTVSRTAVYDDAGVIRLVEDDWVLHLPPIHPQVTITDHSGGPAGVAAAPDTVVFGKATGTFTVTWRAATPLPAGPDAIAAVEVA